MAQFTITTGTITGAAGSLITILDAALVAAGWTKAFSGTNKAAYRQGTGSNGMYLRVQDDGPGAGSTREARMTGYETMSDVDTGTNPFPSVAQGVGGVAMVVCRKSATTDGTTRDYKVIADARTCYILIKSEAASGVAGDWSNFGFGEFYSFQLSDPYRVFIIGRTQENTSAATVNNLTRADNLISANTTGHFMPRGHNGTYGPINFGKTGDWGKGDSSGGGFGIVPYTNPSDGGLYLAPYWVSDPNTAPANGLRGRLRGVWHFLHPVASVNDGDTASGGGSGDLAGKTFLFVKNTGSSGTASGIIVIETSNTLETN